jgi:hypothetical protein
MTMMAAAWDAIPALVSQLRVDSDPITIVEAFQELGRALRESEIVAASAILGTRMHSCFTVFPCRH